MAGKLKIGVVISSTREGRIGERVTTFVKHAILKDHEVVVFGRMGGSRAAVQLRIFTGGMGMMAVPTNTSIPFAHETLDESGNTKDNKLNEELNVTLKQVYWVARALKSYAENNPTPNWASSKIRHFKKLIP